MSYQKNKGIKTLKELALLLNLAPSTISKSLNDSPEISSKTKSRVKEMAWSHGYFPNNIPRGLEDNLTKSIGVILPNVVDEFFAMLLQGVEKEVKQQKYKLLIALSEDHLKKEAECLNSIIECKVDGILISWAQETQQKGTYGHFNKLEDYRLPLVQFDRTFEGIPYDQVTIDDFDGSYRATKYLLESGCKKIAFLSKIANTSVGELRKEGYIQALNLEGAERFKPILISVKSDGQFKYNLYQAIKDNGIDGILASDTRSAISAMNLVQREGYRVPEDISIIGYADGALGEYSNPPLTTVCQHAEELGMMAVRVLLHRLERKHCTKYFHTVVKSKLIIRESTKRVNKNNKFTTDNNVFKYV